MLYQITRGGQSYGPYTLADLQRYVASGHVLLTDLAKSDEMAEWVPVSQILNPSGLPPAAPVAGEFAGTSAASQEAAGYPQQAGYAPPVGTVNSFQDPPNLHWGLVLLFDVLTCGVFQIVWNFVLAAWVKRVEPNTKAIIYYAVGYGLLFISSGISFPSYIAVFHHGHASTNLGAGLINIVGWVFRILARFEMKTSLEQHFNSTEPINFEMSGVLTFFFGGIYIQSQLNRINEIKQAIRYRDFGR